MAALVVGGDLLLGLTDDPALAARAADHPIDGLFQSRTGDNGPVLAGGEQRGLVDHVGQISAGHAHRSLRQTVKVSTRRQRLAL